MYTGAVSRQSDAIRRDESGLHRGKNCGNPEDLLQQKFIMKREIFIFKSVISNDFGDAGMPVRKLFILTG